MGLHDWVLRRDTGGDTVAVGGLAGLIDAARVMPVEYRLVRLPWWKAVLKRKRFDREAYNPVFEQLLRRPQDADVPLVWHQIEVPSLTEPAQPAE